MKCFGVLILSVILMFGPAQTSAQNSINGASSLLVHEDALNFIVMGDWGRHGSKRQRKVADQMAKTSAEASVDFIITAGDNFYPSGVQTERDSAWRYSFENVYDAASLHVPWYPVLGNHDYSGNPDAQILYSSVSDRWRMPSRYYERRFFVDADSSSQVLILFIDTTPLIRSYYERRSLHVHGQDTTAQLRWIEETLSSASRDVKWTFVVGHHPLFTAGERRNNDETRYIRSVLQPLFRRYNISAYLSGHEHNLQHITSLDGFEQFISGAGSEARRVSVFAPRRFARRKSGFIMFSVLTDHTLVQVISSKGKVLYEYDLKARKL